MYKTLFAKCALLALTLVSLAASAEKAAARNVAASKGRPVRADDMGCFDMYGGGVINSCSEALNFEIALDFDSPGTKRISIAHTPGTACYAFATNYSDTQSWNPTGTGTSQAGAWNITVLDGVQVPSAGVLIVGCTVAPHGRIHSVWWNH